jgi:esterase/lipase superfamily enzyme
MWHRALILAACSIPFSGVTIADEPTPQLEGYILSLGKPLADATVILVDRSAKGSSPETTFAADPSFVASAVTDINGVFVFFHVPSGKLGLQVSKPRFQPAFNDVEFHGTPVKVNIELTPGSIPFSSTPEAAQVSQVKKETIFFATDRKPARGLDSKTFFTNQRSSDGMHYGTAVVTVPSAFEAGDTLSPEELFNVGDDRIYNVVLLGIQGESSSDFFSQLGLEGKTEDALVFIHGYSNSFEYAARRLGALKHDLRFLGPTILYSWASRNSLSSYSDDEATTEWSSPHFQRFLQDLFHAGVRRVHFVAHSMGNRILLRGLEGCNEQRVGQVVFAAPDVDAETFREALTAIGKLADRITEYANDKDRALWLSSHKHGLPRAGQLRAAIHNSGEDVVDANRVDTSLDHHSYFANSPQVVSDIALVITGKIPPRPRLHQIREGQITYWQLQP